jgi:hypothetical protein
MPPTELTLEAQHDVIVAFSAGLPLWSDAEQVRATLATAFAHHVGDLWQQGDPNATPAWVAANVDSVLATVERLFAVAIQDFPDEFFARMRWLPGLLQRLDRPAPLEGNRRG